MFNINNTRQFLGNVYQNYIRQVLPSVDTVKQVVKLTFIGGAGAYIGMAAVYFFDETDSI